MDLCIFSDKMFPRAQSATGHAWKHVFVYNMLMGWSPFRVGFVAGDQGAKFGRNYGATRWIQGISYIVIYYTKYMLNFKFIIIQIQVTSRYKNSLSEMGLIFNL